MLGKQLKSSDFNINNKDVYLNKRITNGKPGLLLIYADWCGYCQRFKPTFKEIASILGNNFPCTSIEESDLKNKDKLRTALDFEGFPTIKFFDQHGKIIGNYKGDRSKNDILTQICQTYHHCVNYH
jgi:thiol-disulfide isomerase/thioredoxin